MTEPKLDLLVTGVAWDADSDGYEAVVKLVGRSPALEADIEAALAAHFTAARDTELGRTRDPVNPDCVVYRTPDHDDDDGRSIRVLNERTGVAAVSWERYIRAAGELAEVANRWYAANPPAPAWHSAKLGEAWSLTIDGETGAAVVGRSLDGLSFVASTGFTYDVTDPRITAGACVWGNDA